MTENRGQKAEKEGTKAQKDSMLDTGFWILDACNWLTGSLFPRSIYSRLGRRSLGAHYTRYFSKYKQFFRFIAKYFVCLLNI